MARLYIADNVEDQNFIPVIGAKIYVRANGDNASLEDLAGNPIENPLTSGSDGFFEAYSTSDGTHTLEYYWGGKLRYIRAVSDIDQLQAVADEAADSAVAAAESAAFAEEFSGPAYASQAAGEAATTTGQFFRVSNGDTPRTYTRYERTAGGSVVAAALATTSDLALATGGSLVGFQQTGTGAQLRDLMEKGLERVTPEDFGAIGDGNPHPLSERYATLAAAQVDYPFATALTQQIDYCAIVAAINSQTFATFGPFYQSGPEIHLRDGAIYRMGSDTLQLKKSVHIRGAASGQPWTAMAAMQWAAGATGIIVHRFNTIGNTVEGVPTTAGDASILEGFRLLGAVGTADAFGGHGIWLRARAQLRNLYIQQFRGNGYHIVATAGGGGALEGNANNFEVHGGRVQDCENGAFIDGADTNAGSFINGDYTGNRRWGIWDSSFLGNNYFNVHTDSNGDAQSVDSTSAFASFGGVSYQAVPTASAGDLVATTPGTNSAIWHPLASGVGSRAIAWTGSNPSGTYRPGGPVYTDNANGRCNLFGQYNESGQGVMFLSPVTMLIGGIWDIPVGGSFLRALNNDFSTQSGVISEDTNPSGKTITAKLGGDSTNGDVFLWQHSDDNASFPSRFRRSGADWIADNGNSGARQYYALTGELTSRQFGTGANVPYVFATQRIGLGDGADARFITYGSAAPTTGAHAQGEIVFNIAPTAGGKVGFVCTAAGTPGTWKAFGVIDA